MQAFNTFNGEKLCVSDLNANHIYSVINVRRRSQIYHGTSIEDAPLTVNILCVVAFSVEPATINYANSSQWSARATKLKERDMTILINKYVNLSCGNEQLFMHSRLLSAARISNSSQLQ